MLRLLLNIVGFVLSYYRIVERLFKRIKKILISFLISYALFIVGILLICEGLVVWIAKIYNANIECISILIGLLLVILSMALIWFGKKTK